jgi:hypothetical protein
MRRHRDVFVSAQSVLAFSLFSCVALSISASSLSAQALSSGGVLFRPGFGGTPYNATSGAAPSATTGYTLFPGASAVNSYDYTGAPGEQFAGSVDTKVWVNNSTGKLAFTYVFNNIVPPIGGPSESDILGLQIEETLGAWHGVHILSAGADPTGGKSTAASGAMNWMDGTPLSMSFEQSSSTSGVAVDFSSIGQGTQLRQPSTNNPDKSAIIWFQTDATRYINNAIVDLNDPVGTTKAFAPVLTGGIGTPEPTTLVLALFGCLGGALMLWRRQSSK